MYEWPRELLQGAGQGSCQKKREEHQGLKMKTIIFCGTWEDCTLLQFAFTSHLFLCLFLSVWTWLSNGTRCLEKRFRKPRWRRQRKIRKEDKASGQIQTTPARIKCQSGTTLIETKERSGISFYDQRLGRDIASQDKKPVSLFCASCLGTQWNVFHYLPKLSMKNNLQFFNINAKHPREGTHLTYRPNNPAF